MSNSKSSVLEPPPVAPEETSSEPGEASTIDQDTAADNLATQDMTPVLARLRRGFLDTYHHRPQRLWVSVNGIPVASLDIFNQQNTLSVTTKVAEPLSFIEVLSEQEIRLAMLNANPESGNPVENDAKIELSDERSLSVSFVERDSGLSICLGYTDPGIEGWERLASLGLIQPPG
ncbi:MAG: hypothetical protein ACRD8U_16135, partial [Pyrinomonadaceae bacterium]